MKTPQFAAFLALSLVIFTSCEPPLDQQFITSDIDYFWNAYDQILQTDDSTSQAQILQDSFLTLGSPGLESIMEVRNYSLEEYLNAIHDYPRFWGSIRAQTTSVADHFPEIEHNIRSLQKVYPDLQLVPIYFTMGVFRTGGTVHEGKVLIGCELSTANENTVIEELPEWRQPFYQESVPVEDLPLLCAHEYIHTQQKDFRDELLLKCMYEGVAEFVSCLATNTPSASPAIAFGQANRERVVEMFVQDLFMGDNDYNWLWGQNRNELQVRDLGYYIGYEICERYYTQAEDKQAAIKTLIELDYNDTELLESIVDASELLPKKVAELRAEFEAARPVVTGVVEFENGAKNVDPATKEISVRFSKKLSGYHAGIDYGPLGEDFCPKMDPFSRKWAADSMGYTVAVALEPGTKYQFSISSNFRTTSGVRIRPYVIEFETRE